MNRIIKHTVGLLLLIAASNSAWAALNCFAVNGMPRIDTVQLSPAAISAGADVAVGTVIYQGQWISGLTGSPTMNCTSPTELFFWINLASGIEKAPMPLSNWAGSPFGGAVYQTNIPGVGIAISRSNNSNAIIVGQPVYEFPSDNERQITGGLHSVSTASRTLYITLIKIGAITPGSYTLDATKLPQAHMSYTNPLSHPATAAGLPVKIYQIQFQGQLTVSAQTCTTPDVNVSLGSFDIRQNFTGQGATTPWVDASIILTHCPTFYGFYNAANSTVMFDYSTGTGLVANSTNNSIGVRLTPATDVVDAANGVMAIDSAVSGAASGVGIQIGWGESGQTPTPFNFMAEQAVTLPKDGSPTIRVPLAARYIQTASKPTPGKANGKVTFTVNYY